MLIERIDSKGNLIYDNLLKLYESKSRMLNQIKNDQELLKKESLSHTSQYELLENQINMKDNEINKLKCLITKKD